MNDLTAEHAAQWRLRLNGQPQLLAPDGKALLLDRHGALVAARLALAGPQAREVLARQLWPEADEGRARGNPRYWRRATALWRANMMSSS